MYRHQRNTFIDNRLSTFRRHRAQEGPRQKMSMRTAEILRDEACVPICALSKNRPALWASYSVIVLPVQRGSKYNLSFWYPKILKKIYVAFKYKL